MLIPPREFSYNIEKGLVTLFNSAHLSTGISMSDIICNGKTIESKYKGKEYYSSLLKKKFNYYAFGDSVKLEFELDSQHKEIEARLEDLEYTQDWKDTSYKGITMSLPSVSVELSKRSKSPSINWIVTLWIVFSKALHQLNNTLALLRNQSPLKLDNDDLLKSDDNTTMVKCMHLPTMIKFTKECGCNVRPGDHVSIAHGPEFGTKGVVSSVDFPNGQLTLETKMQYFVKVLIRFIMKTSNIDLNAFNHFIKKEVFVIGGEKKGFQATLYGLFTNDCIIIVHD
ncbi:hypothetical protein BD769DRAFT_1385288 [Suillus cothurnatus]|nr:hypothetical protein BD769DRAFT_1385288 [Suillus cothurnatus]